MPKAVRTFKSLVRFILDESNPRKAREEWATALSDGCGGGIKFASGDVAGLEWTGSHPCEVIELEPISTLFERLRPYLSLADVERRWGIATDGPQIFICHRCERLYWDWDGSGFGPECRKRGTHGN